MSLKKLPLRCTTHYLYHLAKASPSSLVRCCTSYSKTGRYADRRTGQAIDCSKIIWVLASNTLDEVVRDFYRDKPTRDSTGGTFRNEGVAELHKALLVSARSKLGESLTGDFLIREISNCLHHSSQWRDVSQR